MPRKQPPIDNRELVSLIRHHQKKLRRAVAKRASYQPKSTRRCKPRGVRMSERLGELLLELATRLATRPNFAGYTYDLAAAAMPALMRGCELFDCSRGNAHAYLTMICWRDFCKSIGRENRRGFGHIPDGAPIEVSALPNLLMGSFDAPGLADAIRERDAGFHPPAA